MAGARAGRAETGGSLDLLATSGVPVSLGDPVSKERHGGDSAGHLTYSSSIACIHIHEGTHVHIYYTLTTQ